jgi:hypothetical protein
MKRDAIGEQIGRILRSECFADKIQLAKLLNILFENMEIQTVLKPDRIIKELWPEETKTKRSADIATKMTRLRRAVESYCKEDGKADPITISFPRRLIPGPDGKKERRWIAAEPRSAFEAHPTPPTPTLASTPPDPSIPPDIRVQRPFPDLRMKSRKGLIVLAAVVGLGVVAYVAVRILTADYRPQSGHTENSALVIMNAEGKELWRKEFPDGFRSEYYNPGQAAQEANNDPEVSVNRTFIWIGDLDGDGHTSVLFLYQPATDPKLHSTTLICYSDKGKEKWRWTPGRNLPELDSIPSIYITMGIAVLKAPPGQPRRIVVMSRHFIYCPTQIAIVSATGKTLSEYWHSGHLWQFILASMGSDRREEILAFGISNGYHQATLLMLAPTKFLAPLPRPPVRRFKSTEWGRPTSGFVCCSPAAI